MRGALLRRLGTSSGAFPATDPFQLAGLYERAVFGLDARRTPSGVPTDLSPNALPVQNGSTSGSDNSDVLHLPAPSTYGVDRYVYLPDTAGSGLTLAATTDHGGATELDIRVACAMDDWSNGLTRNLFAGSSTAASGSPFRLFLLSDGSMRIEVSDGGAWQVAQVNGFPIPVSDGLTAIARTTWRASDQRVQFLYKVVAPSAIATEIASNTDWLQLDSDCTLASGPASLPVMSTTFGIGRYGAATTNTLGPGLLLAARVGWTIDGSAWLDWSAEDPVNATHTEFTASTGQTVTVNRATSGRKTAVVEAAKWLLGTDDYIEVADNALLDIDAATDFTVLAVVRQFATPTSNGRYVDKRNNSTDGLGWAVRSSGTSLAAETAVDAGATEAVRTTATYAAGGLRLLGFVANRAAATMAGVLDGSLTATTSLASIGSAANSFPMRIGAPGDVINGYQDFELYAVYVWREALSPSELTAIAADWGAA